MEIGEEYQELGGQHQAIKKAEGRIESEERGEVSEEEARKRMG